MSASWERLVDVVLGKPEDRLFGKEDPHRIELLRELVKCRREWESVRNRLDRQRRPVYRAAQNSREKLYDVLHLWCQENLPWCDRSDRMGEFSKEIEGLFAEANKRRGRESFECTARPQTPEVERAWTVYEAALARLRPSVDDEQIVMQPISLRLRTAFHAWENYTHELDACVHVNEID